MGGALAPPISGFGEKSGKWINCSCSIHRAQWTITETKYFIYSHTIYFFGKSQDEKLRERTREQ